METMHSSVAQALGALAWAPPWAVSLGLFALALAAALLLHGLLVRMVGRALNRDRLVFWRSLLVRTRAPTRLALIVVALSLASPVAPLTGAQRGLVQHGLLISLIVLLGWMTLSALDIGAALYLRGFKVDVEDNLLARKHLTQIRILRRAVATLVVLVTVALALMTISGVRQWGVSLLAAGGAASIIVGLALQPLLSNLIAGIQIAVTQPIRIDDAVVVEGEWGRIEEINSTYVVVRLWDLRRMVLPLSWFIQNPFQNWTRETAGLIGAVHLHVDYSAPVAAMRRKLEELVRGTQLWDGEVVNLQVTEARERTMEVRCLVSGRNSGDTFDLRCEIREKMIQFLKTEHPGALPRDRLELEGLPREDRDRAGGAGRQPEI